MDSCFRPAGMATCSTWSTCCSTGRTWRPRTPRETRPCTSVPSTTRSVGAHAWAHSPPYTLHGRMLGALQGDVRVSIGARTQPHRWGSTNSYFYHPGGWRSQIRVPADSVPTESSFLGADGHHLSVSSFAGERTGALWCLFGQGLSGQVRTSPNPPHLPNTHFPNPSHWGYGFMEELRGTPPAPTGAVFTGCHESWLPCYSKEEASCGEEEGVVTEPELGLKHRSAPPQRPCPHTVLFPKETWGAGDP